MTEGELDIYDVVAAQGMKYLKYRHTAAAWFLLVRGWYKLTADPVVRVRLKNFITRQLL